MNTKKEIQKAKPAARKIVSVEKDNMSNFIILMVVLYFISLFISIQFFHILDLSLFHFFRLNVLFIGCSFLIPITLYRKKLSMSFYEYTLINILAIGPLLCTLCLVINFAFKGDVYSETYEIAQKNRDRNFIVLRLKDDIYEDKAYLRTISDLENTGAIGSGNRLKIQFSDGLFGIRIIEKKELTK